MPLAVALQTVPETGQPVVERNQQTLRVFFKVTPSGDYPTGGDPLDLTQLFGAGGIPGLTLPTRSLPLKVTLISAKPAAAPQTNMFVYNFAPGTTLSNGTMQVMTGAAAQTALTELSAGAYPAGVLADTILGEAVYPIS